VCGFQGTLGPGGIWLLPQKHTDIRGRISRTAAIKYQNAGPKMLLLPLGAAQPGTVKVGEEVPVRESQI